MGDSLSGQLSDGMCIGGKNLDFTHNQRRPMTTQIKSTDQVLTDEQLEALNGAGVGATLGWAFANIPTLGIPIIVDAATGGHVTDAAGKSSF